MIGPVLELQREDLELEVGGARVVARRLWPGAAAAAAPTLVLLHEGLGCVDAWRAFPERLVRATGLPALLYDRHGYGRSSALDRPWGVDWLSSWMPSPSAPALRQGAGRGA